MVFSEGGENGDGLALRMAKRGSLVRNRLAGRMATREICFFIGGNGLRGRHDRCTLLSLQLARHESIPT